MNVDYRALQVILGQIGVAAFIGGLVKGIFAGGVLSGLFLGGIGVFAIYLAILRR